MQPVDALLPFKRSQDMTSKKAAAMGRASSTESAGSTLSCITVAGPTGSSRSSSAASTTPPTSLGDVASVDLDASKPAQTIMELSASRSRSNSDASTEQRPPAKIWIQKGRKWELVNAAEAAPPPTLEDEFRTIAQAPKTEEEKDSDRRRSSRPRHSLLPSLSDTYLSGSHVHTRKGFHNAAETVAPGSRTVSGDTLVSRVSASSQRLLDDGINALDLDWSVDALLEAAEQSEKTTVKRSKSKRLSLGAKAAFNSLASNLGKRGRDALESGKEKLQAVKGERRQSRMLQDAETEIESNNEDIVKPAKKPRMSVDSAPESPSEAQSQSSRKPQHKTKKWLKQGLYVGQELDFDPRLTESKNKLKKASKSKSDTAAKKVFIPLPMFAGARTIREGKDFVLPFDVFNPLPWDQKPSDWNEIRKNCFVGEASALWKNWKKSNLLAPSLCLCTPESGCGEDCQNRFMQYECDDTNCRVGAEHCTNRAFAELKKRSQLKPFTKKMRDGSLRQDTRQHPFEKGVEVMLTADRGYGVRATRPFEPGQIIVEYAGEIITQDECDRRMNNEYKDKKDYYLMTFHNKLIIDATRGSIARFVNHSCEPNCRIDKWMVAGEPRMALFAGANGIMTGEELTYDYNFDPFSHKNIQTCRCGTATCRGFLGPKPKEPTKPKTASNIIAGAKRRIKEIFHERDSQTEDEGSAKKKRRMSSALTDTLAKTKARLTQTTTTTTVTTASTKSAEQNEDRAARAARRSSSTLTLVHASGRISKHSSASTLRSAANSGTSSASHTSPRRRTPPRSKLSRLASAVKKQAQSLTALPAKRLSRPAVYGSTSSKLRQSTLSFEPLKLGFEEAGSSTEDTLDPYVEAEASTTTTTTTTIKNVPASSSGRLSRPSTAPRPMTASSIRSAATSFRANVVRSVRGTRRATAAARMGFTGEEGVVGVSEKTIRMVFGDDVD